MDIRHVSDRLRAIAIICFAILATLFATIFVSSDCGYGLADNGDYYRLSSSVGVHHVSWDDETLIYSVRHDFKKNMEIEPHQGSGYFPARLAVLISDLRGEETFSLSNLSIIYLILYLLGIFLLLGNVIRRLPLIVALILTGTFFIILLSPLYVAYFGSFYDEAFFFPCLLMALVLWRLEISAEGGESRWLKLVPYAVCILLALAATSKLQNLVFLVLLIPYAGYKKSKRVAAFCVLLVAVSVYSQQSAFGRFAEVNAYHRLFFGLLLTAESEQAQEVLEELELLQHGGRIGTDYWQSAEIPGGLPPGIDMEELDRRHITGQANLLNILSVYLTSPRLVGSTVNRAVGMIRGHPARIDYLAYSNCDDAPLFRHLDLWPAFYSLSFPLLLLVPLLAIFAAADRATRSFLGVQMLACLGGISVVILGDGFWEFQKHLIPVSFATSLLLIFSVIALFERAILAVRDASGTAESR